MKQTKRPAFFISFTVSFCLTLILLPYLLSSCTSAKHYQDDLSCAELAEMLKQTIPVEFGYETFSDGHVQYYFENTSLYDNACLCYSVRSEDINEFGIFHTTDPNNLPLLTRSTEAYLQQMYEDQAAFIAGYAAGELPKLEQAEIRTFGNYVIYAVLSEEDRKIFFDTAEQKLSKTS